MRRSWLLLIWLAAAVADGALVIGSLNVRNYLQMNRWEHAAYRFDYPKPEAEKAALRQLLLQERPDILFLQEMGDARFVAELQRDLADLGLRYPYAETALQQGSVRSLAVLSMVAPEQHLLLSPVVDPGREGGEQQLRRGIHEVRFDVGGIPLHCFHVHIKSRYSEDDADPSARLQRKGEISALTEVVRQRLALQDGSAVLVIGDFNTPLGGCLLDGLRALDLHQVEYVDTSGTTWTYQQLRSGKRERIDGAFVRDDRRWEWQQPRLVPDDTEPLTFSDHRLLLVTFALIANRAAACCAE
jgi:endonuclease/exonuclease/phosphatase family metal-dependent hydrolase